MSRKSCTVLKSFIWRQKECCAHKLNICLRRSLQKWSTVRRSLWMTDSSLMTTGYVMSQDGYHLRRIQSYFPRPNLPHLRNSCLLLSVWQFEVESRRLIWLIFYMDHPCCILVCLLCFFVFSWAPRLSKKLDLGTKKYLFNFKKSLWFSFKFVTTLTICEKNCHDNHPSVILNDGASRLSRVFQKSFSTAILSEAFPDEAHNHLAWREAHPKGDSSTSPELAPFDMDEQHLDSEVSPDVLISLSLRLSRVTLENNLLKIFFLVSIRPLMTDKSRTLSLSLAPFLVCMSLCPNPMENSTVLQQRKTLACYCK